jgi:hypothetical protein
VNSLAGLKTFAVLLQYFPSLMTIFTLMALPQTLVKQWCERRESNPHGGCPLDPKSSASAIPPLSHLKRLLYICDYRVYSRISGSNLILPVKTCNKL